MWRKTARLRVQVELRDVMFQRVTGRVGLASCADLAVDVGDVAFDGTRADHQLGGNLAFNDPHSDPGTVLLIHDASVVVGHGRGERSVALDRFFVDTYATALEPGELLLEIEIPALTAGMQSAYRRLIAINVPPSV